MRIGGGDIGHDREMRATFFFEHEQSANSKAVYSLTRTLQQVMRYYFAVTVRLCAIIWNITAGCLTNTKQSIAS